MTVPPEWEQVADRSLESMALLHVEHGRGFRTLDHLLQVGYAVGGLWLSCPCGLDSYVETFGGDRWTTLAEAVAMWDDHLAHVEPEQWWQEWSMWLDYIEFGIAEPSYGDRGDEPLPMAYVDADDLEECQVRFPHVPWRWHVRSGRPCFGPPDRTSRLYKTQEERYFEVGLESWERPA